MQLCQVQSSSNDQQVFLAIQPLQAFATMSDDGVQDVFNSHAISQPDIACHSSCNLDEGKGSSTISSTTFSSHPRTVSTHGNHTQVENTLPQDLQNEAKTKLEDIIKMHEEIKMPQAYSSFKAITKIKAIDKHISNPLSDLLKI